MMLIKLNTDLLSYIQFNPQLFLYKVVCSILKI